MRQNYPRRYSLAAIALGAILISFVPPVSAASANRFALVIGNADYRHVPLRNPVNDARAMSEMLRRLGFQVISLENADKSRMEHAIVEFTGRLGPDSTGVFYYAGHGVQVSGRNYLVPVGTDIASEREARVEATGVHLLLEELSFAGNPINIVILDACRNNPFERRFRGGARGLAAIDAARGTLIAYATAPGSVALDGDGSNGLYTEELLRSLATPGLKVEEVFKRVRQRVAIRTGDQQIPWESSSLIGDFVFNQASTTVVTEGFDQTDSIFWDSVKHSDNPDMYRAYIEQFPDGVFASLARLRIEELERADEPRATAPSTSSYSAEGAMSQSGTDQPPVAIQDSQAQVAALSPAPSSGSSTSSTRRARKTQLDIAILPVDGKVWCPGGIEETPLVYSLIRKLHRSKHISAAYYPPGSRIKLGERPVKRTDVWRRSGLRRRPNEARAYEYGHQMEVDAVLLLWYEARGGGYCNRTEVEAFLFDIELKEVYTATELSDDFDDLARILTASLRDGRKRAGRN